MKRRTLLRAAGASAVAGSSALSGCLGALGDAESCDASGDGRRWCYGVGGDVDAVADGTLYVREQSAAEVSELRRRLGLVPPADGEVVALDADTGEVQWTYGETGQMDTYSGLAVDDGVYFTLCTDDPCIGLFALDADGQERWTREIDAGYWRPVVADGTVYASGYPVRAIDASSGETRWTYPEQSDSGGRVLEVDDVVYVQSSGLAALDRSDGSVRWEYDLGDRNVLDEAVVHGSVSVVTTEGVTAVADGDEAWHWAFQEEIDTATEFVGSSSGHLFVQSRDERHEYRLHALNVATGERDWVSDSIEHPNPEFRPAVAVHDSVAYVGAERLRALDAASGEERWSRAADGAFVSWVRVDEPSSAGDHAVFAKVGEGRLAEFTPEGERTWDGSVDGQIEDYLVGEHVFVATDDRIYALDRAGGQ